MRAGRMAQLVRQDQQVRRVRKAHTEMAAFAKAFSDNSDVLRREVLGMAAKVRPGVGVKLAVALGMGDPVRSNAGVLDGVSALLCSRKGRQLGNRKTASPMSFGSAGVGRNSGFSEIFSDRTLSARAGDDCQYERSARPCVRAYSGSIFGGLKIRPSAARAAG